MSNIGSEFDGRIGQDVAKAERLVAGMDAGDVLSYEQLEDIGDPGWHAIRDRLVEVPGEGWRLRQDTE